MKVLRKGGKFAQSRISFYRTKTLSVYAAALLALVLIGGLVNPTIALVVGFFILLFGKHSSEKWDQWWKGFVGEKAIIKALGALPDDYILVNDLTLPGRHGNIDHFLVGPNGLFLLETKNYSGEIECHEDDWFVNGRKIKSISKQAKGNAVAVRSSLAAALPNLESLAKRFVVAVLVFVGPEISLKSRNPTVPVPQLPELADWIRRYPCKASIPPEDRREIVYHLLSAHAIGSRTSQRDN